MNLPAIDNVSSSELPAETFKALQRFAAEQQIHVRVRYLIRVAKIKSKSVIREDCLVSWRALSLDYSSAISSSYTTNKVSITFDPDLFSLGYRPRRSTFSVGHSNRHVSTSFDLRVHICSFISKHRTTPSTRNFRRFHLRRLEHSCCSSLISINYWVKT